MRKKYAIATLAPIVAMLAFGAGEVRADDTISDKAARERTIEQRMDAEDRAAAQAAADSASNEDAYMADNKAAIKHAEHSAENFKNSRGERGLTPDVMLKLDGGFDDATQTYKYGFHYEVYYKDGRGVIHKIAVFDQAGKLVSFENTPYANAADAVSAHTPPNLIDSGVDWVFSTDANGTVYPALATIKGRDSEKGGPIRTRVKLWFNENGTPYKGETFGLDGKLNGGFVGKDDARPKAGDPQGPLSDVAMPRIVTQPCEKCRALAEQRNEIAHQAADLARTLNQTAAEQRAAHNAGVKTGSASQAATALRLNYEANLPRYLELMEELAAAHSALLDCEAMCIPPKEAMALGIDPPLTTPGGRQPVTGAMLAYDPAQGAATGSLPPKPPEIATPAGSDGTYFTVAPSLFFGNWEGPRFIYMGFENSALQQTFAVEDLKGDDAFAGFDLHIAGGLSRTSAIHFGVTGYDVSFGGARPMIDPLGQDLLFPGVTTPGFSLAGFVPEGTPGGFNVVENLRYAFNADNTTFYGAYSQACDHGPFVLIGYGGLALTTAHQNQNLRGFIPGYGFGFEYDTHFQTDIVRATVGARAIYHVPQMPDLSAYAGATAMLNFADTNGRDSLLLDGISQELDIGRSETTFGYSLGVGGEYALGSLSLFGEVRYTDDDTTPVAVRHDDGPSRAEFERSKAFTGRFGGRLTF